MKNVAILGYGTVGSGVYEVLTKNKDIIAKRAGEELCVKYVLDLRDFPGDPVESVLVHDFNEILNDADVELVCEVMGGVDPAFSFVKSLLEAGKSVATSNKELVAAHGAELIAAAKAHDVNFFFEASAGGGIPIVRPLMTSVTADDIEEITGILNGTTNYILTKMSAEGSDFETVLKSAQELGYAERNPEADIEGHDACRKIAILTALAYGKQVDYQDIHTEGITKISDKDIKYAKEMKASIKLFGKSWKEDGKVFAMVAPMLIKPSHPLYHVEDVFNGIFVHGNMVDDLMFYGRGAGKLPTASAVVGDLVEMAKNSGRTVPIVWEQEKLALADINDAKHRFFVRMTGGDLDTMDAIQLLFGNVIYVQCKDIPNETAFVTEAIREEDFREILKNCENVLNYIRVAF